MDPCADCALAAECPGPPCVFDDEDEMEDYP